MKWWTACYTSGNHYCDDFFDTREDLENDLSEIYDIEKHFVEIGTVEVQANYGVDWDTWDAHGVIAVGDE